MSNIAFLGLGAMGSRMAKNLIKSGHKLKVWNRSPHATDELKESGAGVASSPREAVVGSDFVISMLKDDQASRQVWLDPKTGALAGMGSSSIAIESSTLTPAWVRELASYMEQVGVRLLDAPVSGSRPQAEAGQLVYLVGGELSTVESSKEVLTAMGASIHHMGPVGHGTVVKLATNALLGIQVAALAEVIGLIQGQGVDPAKAIAAVSSTSVWPPVANYLASSMLTSNFAPQFPVALIEKDLRYVLDTGEIAGMLPLTGQTLAVFHRANLQGLGAENMTSVAKLYR
ncbi:NAD(P)-dependent oxidoreductase [Xanthomonas euvesicatoria]|uniref:NAD(P)-dependent oxidoreductase n=1 Tax=Xanthomonas euvesicatoria TaxID=456327 RepID=UPI0030C817F1